MVLLQTVDKPANGGPERSGNEQGPQAITDPGLDQTSSQAISEAAYYRAEARGFESGHELEDWIEAERQVVETKSPVAAAARA